MKKGYIRLLVFWFFVGIILFLNSFVWNILLRYVLDIFLLVLIIIFRFLFGFEKDRHRYVKDVLLDIIIFLIIYFILYYLLGIVIGFARSGDYYNVGGFINFIIPIILLVILREFFRYQVMQKSLGSRVVIVFGVIIFIWFDVSNAIFYRNFSSSYNIFVFFALSIFPSVSSNIVFSYLTVKVGYKPVMLYSLVMSLYYYLIPIIPNPNEYLTSVINFLLPIILWYRMYLFFKKVSDEEIDRFYRKGYYGWLGLGVFFTVGLVYFTSGYFRLYAIAVASGSMSPSINKGDVVVIERVDDYSKIKRGDVLAFRYDNVIIVHRVVDVIYDDGYYFYTKGDANDKVDNFFVDEGMVMGVVNVKVPWIGIPTVWLNEL